MKYNKESFDSMQYLRYFLYSGWILGVMQTFIIDVLFIAVMSILIGLVIYPIYYLLLLDLLSLSPFQVIGMVFIGYCVRFFANSKDYFDEITIDFIKNKDSLIDMMNGESE